ncbi:hypothetical protein NDU88_004735 [Pleurodeles waltl]|uniref:Uncharacterized protein n=1 Tax=Pleurodeles waltl TaxID=8319 RepID=A0AAV7W9S6_PLEWA|nr:hypothetical protein NDU88_004735 [Pleurodeles waltl]
MKRSSTQSPVALPLALDTAVLDVQCEKMSDRLMLEVNIGENELELDYDEGSDKWEEDDMHAVGEVCLLVAQDNVSGGTTGPVAGVLQKSSVDNGGTS